MTDIVDRGTRSRMMSGIHSRDTRIELLVRKGLFAKGYRYRVDDKRLPGSPDLVFPKYRAVIFVHGCYWHGHSHGCRLFRLPKSNTEFWSKKIEANRDRDRRVIRELLDSGWRVAVIWECSLRGQPSAVHQYILDCICKWFDSPVQKYVEFSG